MSLDTRQILRIEAVCDLVGLGRSTIYAKVTAGYFPKPVRLGRRAVGWRLTDLDRWLEAPERAWDPQKAL